MTFTPQTFLTQVGKQTESMANITASPVKNTSIVLFQSAITALGIESNTEMDGSTPLSESQKYVAKPSFRIASGMQLGVHSIA